MKWIALALTAGGMLCGTVGCRTTTAQKAATPQPHVAELPPVPDRLRAFYHETRAGKFEILADFEQPAQAEIFAVSGPGSANITVRHSRVTTGAGALEVQLAGGDSTLIVDGENARNWTLIRDWSKYQLFMASVYAPAPMAIGLQIRSGTDNPAWYASDIRPLEAGWNLVRIDLGEAARQINLTDIRQIRLTARAETWPATFYMDDLMLADNTATLFGDPKGEPGSLYVLKKGQRYHVGAAGRFELVFSRGTLSSWYNLATDPNRTIDLAGGGPLGPVLTALDQQDTPLGNIIGTESWMGLGSAVQTHLQVVETTPLAVTIKGTIRYAGPGAEPACQTPDTEPAPLTQPASQPASAPTTQDAQQELEALVSESVMPSRQEAHKAKAATEPATRPAPLYAAASQGSPVEQTYTYTIRQDGRIFVDIDATVASSQFRPAKIGLAAMNLSAVFHARQVDLLDAYVLASSAGNREPEVGSRAKKSRPDCRPAADDSAETPRRAPIPRAVLLAGVREDGPNMLLAPSNPAAYERVISARRQTGDLTAQVYVMNPPAGDHLHLAAMLAVWPADLKDLPTATAIARDYQQPARPVMEVGKLRTDSRGDLDGDGFAEATGRWVVEPDGQILRMRWPTGPLRFWPMVRVTGVAGKGCWPYLDGRIIKPVDRKADGSAEFVVPGILSREALLEVTVEK